MEIKWTQSKHRDDQVQFECCGFAGWWAESTGLKPSVLYMPSVLCPYNYVYGTTLPQAGGIIKALLQAKFEELADALGYELS